MKKIMCDTNCVQSVKHSNISRKMLQAKMIRLRKSISYDTVRTCITIPKEVDLYANEYYKTILSLNYEGNKELLLILKNKFYMVYFNNLISDPNYNSQVVLLQNMLTTILTGLSLQEKELVYNITITKVFYVVALFKTSNPYFIIKNYIQDSLDPDLVYEFNLEDPSNLNTKFCLSINQNKIPVDGLIYNGIPGTTGANVIFQFQQTLSYYFLYIYNLYDKLNPYSWGYNNKIIPIVLNRTIPQTNLYYTTLPILQNANLNIYENKGLSFYINNNTNYIVGNNNYNYAFYYGTYYLNVPKTFSVALLNNSQQNKIQYTGDQYKSIMSNVYFTTDDGSYFFYYDIVKITIYEPFTPISLYSYNYGYLRAYNTIMFNMIDANYAQPEIHTGRIVSNNIETLYSQTRVGLTNINNLYISPMITLNNDINYNYNLTTQKYGVFQGTYLFYTTFYITILNKTKTNLVTISGDNSVQGIGPDGNTYTYYSGVVIIHILGNFGSLSVYTKDYGYAKGRALLVYGSDYNNHIPHSYAFTNETNTIMNDPIDHSLY